MSDYSEGPGWWQASDDKWYPPDQLPGPDPATGAAWAQPSAPPGSWGAPGPSAWGSGAPSYGAGYAPQGGYAYGGPGTGLPSVSGQATASMVLGIVALVLFLCWFLSIVLALVGLPLGLVALNKINKGQAAPDGRGMALAGVILSGISLVLSVGFAVLVLAA